MEQYKKYLEEYNISEHIDYTIDAIKFDKDEKIIKEILVLNKDLIEKSIQVNLINSIDSKEYEKKLKYLMNKNQKATWKKAIKHIMVQEIISGVVMGIETALQQFKKKNTL